MITDQCLPVFGVSSPINDVDFDGSCNYEFKFSGIENGQKFWINDFVETADQSLRLIGDSSLQSPSNHQLDVFLNKKFQLFMGQQ